MDIRPRHLRAIGLLASTDMLKREVAAAVGVNPATLGRWCRDEAFRKEIERRQQVLPEQLDVLRLEAAKRALQRASWELDNKYAHLPLSGLGTVLERLVGRDFARALPTQFDPAPPIRADTAAGQPATTERNADRHDTVEPEAGPAAAEGLSPPRSALWFGIGRGRKMLRAVAPLVLAGL